MPAPSKKPAGARRFRRGDEQVRAVSSFANLDELTAFLQYLLCRIDAQSAEIKRKLDLYRDLEPDRRAAAVRELLDNVKELQTGVIRHGLDPSEFPGYQQRALYHECFGASTPVSTQSLFAFAAC